MLLGILKVLAIFALVLVILYMLLAVAGSAIGILMMKSVYDELSEEEKEDLKDGFKLRK